MRIKHYYCLTDVFPDTLLTPRVLKCLDRFDHKYETETFIDDRTWYTFDVYEDQPVWAELEPILRYRKPNASCNVFSQKELDDAEWLTLRSDNANKIYCEEAADDRVFSCVYHDGDARHRLQTAPYELKKGVKWNGGRMFYGAGGMGFTRLFTSDAGHDRLSAYFGGVSFLPVYKYRTTTPLGDIWQVRFDHCLPDDAIVKGRGEKDISCPVCGRRQYAVGHLYRLTLFRQYLDPGVDFYTTEEVFGEGSPDPMIVCSHSAYMRMKQHGMTAKLRFEPVVLV